MARSKKKISADYVREKKKRIALPNAFEVKINKNHFNIPGRLTSKSMPGVSRGISLEKRKNTVLKKFISRNKKNLFLDKRIGEKNPEMDLETKLKLRLAYEQKTRNSKSKFNLNDDDDLTHMGKPLSFTDLTEDPREDDEDLYDKVGDEFMKKMQFGGGGEAVNGGGVVKNKKLAVEELIAESKRLKYERKVEKDENMELTSKLDAQFEALRPIVMRDKGSVKEPDTKTGKKPQEYDALMRQLQFSAMGGRATERIKTPEEIAKDERERLENLEKQRVERMHASQRTKGTRFKRKHVSADSLDDGFLLNFNKRPKDAAAQDDDNDDFYDDAAAGFDHKIKDTSSDSQLPSRQNKKTVFEEGEEKNEDEDGPDDEQEDEDGPDDEQEDEDDEEKMSDEGENDDDEEDKSASSASSDEEEESEHSDIHSDDDNVAVVKSINAKKKVSFCNKIGVKLLTNDRVAERKNILVSSLAATDDTSSGKASSDSSDNIPYLLDVPANMTIFSNLISGKSPKEQCLIVERIITSNHPRLGGVNSQKLEKFFIIFMQHFQKAAVDRNVDMIEALTPALYSLVELFPFKAAKFMLETIEQQQAQLDDALTNSRDVSFPEFETLTLIRVIGLCFSTSDFFHVCVTPTVIFMSQMLMRCSIANHVDAAKGLFVVNCMLDYVTFSQRFVPDVPVFLRNLLQTFDWKLSSNVNSLTSFKLSLRTLCDESVEFTDDLKCQMLSCTLGLISRAAEIFKKLPSYTEIFTPFAKLIGALDMNGYPEHVSELARNVIRVSETKPYRRPLTRTKKPVRMLKPLEPRIIAKPSGNVSIKWDDERHKQKMKNRKEKRDVRSFMREVKRDSQVIAMHQFSQQIKRDKERQAKTKQIYKYLMNQEGEANTQKRKYGR